MWRCPDLKRPLLRILAPFVQGMMNQPLEALTTYVQHSTKVAFVFQSSLIPLGSLGQGND